MDNQASILPPFAHLSFPLMTPPTSVSPFLLWRDSGRDSMPHAPDFASPLQRALRVVVAIASREDALSAETSVSLFNTDESSAQLPSAVFKPGDWCELLAESCSSPDNIITELPLARVLSCTPYGVVSCGSVVTTAQKSQLLHLLFVDGSQVST